MFKLSRFLPGSFSCRVLRKLHRGTGNVPVKQVASKGFANYSRITKPGKSGMVHERTERFVFRPEMSLRPLADISHMRYLEISSFHVRPGHDAE